MVGQTDTKFQILLKFEWETKEYFVRFFENHIVRVTEESFQNFSQ